VQLGSRPVSEYIERPEVDDTVGKHGEYGEDKEGRKMLACNCRCVQVEQRAAPAAGDADAGARTWPHPEGSGHVSQNILFLFIY
jgi:hypothetical protein